MHARSSNNAYSISTASFFSCSRETQADEEFDEALQSVQVQNLIEQIDVFDPIICQQNTSISQSSCITTLNLQQQLDNLFISIDITKVSPLQKYKGVRALKDIYPLINSNNTIFLTVKLY